MIKALDCIPGTERKERERAGGEREREYRE
jgi:hypothetical protein